MSGELTITAFCPNELFTCSSHLRQQPQSASRNITGFAACAVPMMAEKAATAKNARRTGVIANPFGRWSLQPIGRLHERDRKSVVSGKSVSVRVDLGGRRIIKKQSNKTKHHTYKTT